MIGFIVKHCGFGLGKVHSEQLNQHTVFFFSPPQVKTVVRTIDGRAVLKRVLIPLNTICDTQHGQCRVNSIMPAPDSIAAIGDTEPHRYQVEFDNGLTKELSEVELVPREIPPVTSPLEALTDLHLEGYGTFQKREALAETWWSTIRSAQGLRALLSSRIDLRPHQAYVAGTVLMDRVPRYLLADEVGLGKTIEAGIVIHDILERKPSAKILILCPGTLTQQWLCELYAKFSSRVFSMLDLRNRGAQRGEIPDKVIASYPAALKHGTRLLAVAWDLVVVDEAHHLLNAQRLYGLVQQLSQTAPACLLLSAIPAQHREEEYLRLLALLEPDRYHPKEPGAKERFRELYARQVELGRKLNYLNRHLGELSTGVGDAEKILKKLRELAELPILAADDTVRSTVSQLATDSASFAQEARSLLHHVGDRYRISRRILRNRRSQLLDTEPDLKVARRLNRIPYAPEQLEIDAANAVRQLLQKLREAGVPVSVLVPLARALLQASCDPDCLLSFLELAGFETGMPAGMLEFDGHVSYEGWQEFASELWNGIALKLPEAELNELRRAATLWQAGVEKPGRLVALINFLRRSHKQEPAKKLIIFAGFFELGPRVVKALRSEFGAAAVAQFSWDLKDSEKEKQVSRFARDNQCWLLVSDETGGEGRNFQFVDELIHYDLPWHTSRIEQRIGRLDRLGRRLPEVCSNVIYSEGGEDDGLLGCLEKGFQIFVRSISGLEFALSHLEQNLIMGAIADGCEGLRPLAVSILQEAENERAEDDHQAALDAASLERTSAEVYRRVQSTPERDQALERAFGDYFQFIGGQGSMRANPRGYPEGTFEFRPNQLGEVTLQLPAEASGGVRDRIGTFRRALAQDDPNLEFFSVGNDFFDAVCATLHQSATGRTYAVECAWAKGEWRGFEFAYRPTGRCDLLGSHPGLVKHLDRIFAVRLGHCFVRENLKPDPNQASLLLSIRQGLQREDKDIKWRNFTLKNERVQLLTERYPDWPDLVAQAEAVARVAVREHFTLALSSAIELERKRIEEQIRQARLSKSDQWEDEVAGLNALLKAVNDWDLELDFAGFLSVNGGLIA
jgi:ATP-dependent helicase HepA